MYLRDSLEQFGRRTVGNLGVGQFEGLLWQSERLLSGLCKGLLVQFEEGNFETVRAICGTEILRNCWCNLMDYYGNLSNVGLIWGTVRTISETVIAI